MVWKHPVQKQSVQNPNGMEILSAETKDAETQTPSAETKGAETPWCGSAQCGKVVKSGYVINRSALYNGIIHLIKSAALQGGTLLKLATDFSVFYVRE